MASPIKWTARLLASRNWQSSPTAFFKFRSVDACGNDHFGLPLISAVGLLALLIAARVNPWLTFDITSTDVDSMAPHPMTRPARSDERHVGKTCVRKSRSRG